MRVLVTGGTGFTGSHVVPRLVASGFQVRCFVRETSKTAVIGSRNVEFVRGDLGDSASLLSAMRGIDILANLASLGFGHANGIVESALNAGVSRALFFSTTAVFTTLAAPSKSVRLAAEEKIKKSGLRYTIFRPTMIYGDGRDRNMSRLIRYLKRFPVIPVVGNGENLQQPVHVDDLAAAVPAALAVEQTEHQEYNLSGAEPLSFNDVIDTICRLLHRSVLKIHLPRAPVVAALTLAERTGLRCPIRSEQIQRLNEDKAFDHSRASEDFGFSPRSFEEGIRAELAGMGIRSQ